MIYLHKLKRRCLLRRYGDNPSFLKFFPEIDLSTPVGKATFIIFDTETTGLDPKRSELISIGALRVREMTLELSSTFHRFILPTELSRSSVEIHGITLEELREKAEPVERVLEDFLTFAKGSVLVGFNVEFDRKIVDKYVRKLYGIPFSPYRLDIFHLWKSRGGEGKSLKEIAQELGVPSSGTHCALDDAYITALLFLKLAHRLKDEPLKKLPLMV